MSNYKRITEEQAKALVDAGGEAVMLEYRSGIKWTSECPEYVGHEEAKKTLLSKNKPGTVKWKRETPFGYTSLPPTFVVEVE